MKKLLLVLLLVPVFAMAQQRIDGTFAFQSDPAKKYSLYIPSGYTPGVDHRLMVGLHPFNTNRWDAESWCDTLIVFAETNNLILACPDGGADGQVDDDIDTAFTSALMDSMQVWYDIDVDKTYVMGFSWGGKTTYTYGLSHHTRFGGFLPIGAAISGTSEVTEPLQQNAAGKPVYIVHGSSDSPNSRFYPVRDSLMAKGAIVNFNLMSGVGHTIDFPNRNDILGTAYQWIDSVNCATLINNIATSAIEVEWFKGIYPNTAQQGETVQLVLDFERDDQLLLEAYDMSGKLIGTQALEIKAGKTYTTLTTGDWPTGQIIIRLMKGSQLITEKIIIY